MKVIMVLRRDTNNFTIAHILRKMIDRGHKVDVYSYFLEKNHLYMVEKSDIEIKDAYSLTRKKMEEYDIAFVFPAFFEQIFIDNSELMLAEIYYFSFDTTYLDEPIWGTDFMFERGGGWRPKLNYGHRTECTYMIVGDPKHDMEDIKHIDEITNRFLFIDSGHYPFGMEGKREVAKFLLSVCEKFPNYELVVKPRFLKGDTNVTHKNTLHLYTVITELTKGVIPDNLVLLQEHKDLNKEIAKAHTVICMYTTAYIDAAVQGKGLIILDHLPNEENADLRIETHWKPGRAIMASSNCMVDYKEALRYLPEGLKCKEEHIKKQIYSVCNVSEKMVTIIEWIWKEFLSKGRYPKLGEFYYDVAKEQFAADDTLSIEAIIDLRKKNYMYSVERRFYKDMCFVPPNNKIGEYIEKLYVMGELHSKNIWELKDIMCEKLLEYSKDIPSDSISQSYLLRLILNSGKLNKIFEFSKENITVCGKFYYFVLGRALYSQSQYKEAVDAFEKYIGMGKNQYVKELGDMENYLLSAFFYEGMSNMKLEQYSDAKRCFEQCQIFTKNAHRKAKEQLEIIEKRLESR